MIILSKDQAESLAFNSKGKIQPRLLKDGSYALGNEYLNDETFGAYLEGQKRRPVADDEFAA